MKLGDGWLSLWQAGVEKFRLEAAHFHGNPKVWKHEEVGRLAFGIRNARFPGTSVAADIICEIWSGSFGPQVLLRLESLGLSLRGYAYDWLNRDGLTGYVSSRTPIIDQSELSIVLHPCHATLSSEGTFTFRGDNCATVNYSKHALESEQLVLQTVGSAGPVLRRATSRRTHIAVSRGSHEWLVSPPANGWQYKSTDSLSIFDRLEIEAHESAARHKSYAITASRAETRQPVQLILDEPLTGTDGRSPAFFLRGPVYAHHLSSPQDSLTLASLIKPAFLKQGNLMLRLNDPPSTPAVRVVEGQAGVSGSFSADGTLHGRIREAIIIPEPTRDSWPIEIAGSKPHIHRKKSSSHTSVKMSETGAVLSGSLVFRILRPADFIDLRFELLNVTYWISNGNVYIKKKQSDTPSLMIVHLPPQTIAEEAFPSSTAPDADVCKTVAGVSDPQARAFLPKESRISFEVLSKDNEQQIVDLDFLLGWQKYVPHLCGSQMPAEGGESFTALELPAGITFSPLEGSRFATPKRHPEGLFENTDHDTYSTHTGDTYRLWTARLVNKDKLNIIAVGYENQGTSTPLALNDKNRQDIAAQVTEASPLPTKHVVVSSAGGWLKGQAELQPSFCPTSSPKFLDKVSLNIAGGIEQLEEVAYPIVLIPTGHKGSLVVTTKRQWCRDENNLLHAPLIKRYKIVFTERACTYDQTTYWEAGKGYPFPFTTIEIPIRETPTLFATDAATFEGDCESCDDIVSTPYWATILQPPNYDPTMPIPFAFPVICTDRDGVVHQTTMSMVVAAEVRAYSCLQNYIPNLLSAYNNRSGVTNQVIPDFHTENISYATSSKPGNAAYPTGVMNWSANFMKNVQYPLVPWAPQMVLSAISLSTTAGFSQNGNANIQHFRYSTIYCSNPFDLPSSASRTGSRGSTGTPGNAAEIILISQDVPAPLAFYAKLGGGLFQPSSSVAALSRSVGNIFTTATAQINEASASIQDMANGVFSALDAFSQAATLLGAIELSQIIDQVNDIVQNAAAVPKLVAQELGQLSGDITTITNQFTTLLNTLSTLTLSNALSGLFGAIEPQVAYVQAFAFEQVAATPQYVNAQSDLNYLQSLVGNATVAALETQLSASLAARVQSTSSLTIAGQNTFVTLNRMRDFLLNAALQADNLVTPALQVLSAFSADLSSLQLADATAQQYATALQADLTKLSTDLSGFQTAFQSVLTQVSSAYNSVQSSITAIQSAISAATDPLSIINSLQQLASLLTNLQNPIPTDLTWLQPVVNQCNYVNTDVAKLLADFTALVNLVGQETGQTINTAVQTVVAELQTIQTTMQQDFVLNTTVFTGAATNGFLAVLKGLNTFYGTLITAAAGAGQIINGFLQQLADVQQVRASYDYDTPLKSSDLFIASKGANPAALSLHTSITVNVPGLSANPPSPDLIISATVSNFTLLLIPEFSFLSVGFNSASFTSTNGSTPVVNCSLDKDSVQFIGPLNFVTGLAQSISLPGGLSIQQTSTGVSLAYDFSLPAIETGAFTLSNLSLNSGVSLDFTGGAIHVLFGFADPNQHFLMTYTIFGGGGYIDFSFAPQRGVSAFDINGALEFGAEAALDFGVASGDLYIFGGFLFNMTGDELDLGGYVRAGGDLNVLDLITASVEFSLALSYENRGGTAWLVGECDITVDVDIFMVIDTSVDIRMHKEFSNASAS
ncbi:MAG: hypothetical protein ABSF53_20150 [Terracidiphilus sp.]